MDINGTIIMCDGRNFEPWHTEKVTNVIRSLLTIDKNLQKDKMAPRELDIYNVNFDYAVVNALKLLFLASGQLEQFSLEIAHYIAEQGESAFNRVVAEYQLI